MKKLLLAMLLLCNSAIADIVTVKMSTEFLVAPKTSSRTNNTILNTFQIRRRVDPTNNITFGDLGVQIDTLNKDLPWKLVLVNPYSKQTIDADSKMSIEVLASSQVGTLATNTPQVAGRVFLLGDITEYRVVKINFDLDPDTSEVYGAFNIRYRVVRTDTGDHWYPSASFGFRAPGSFGNSTCVSTFTFTPPRITIPTSHWLNVSRTLIISQ